MRRPSLPEAARARLRPSVGHPLWNSLRLRLRSARRFVHALAGVCKVILSAPTQARELGAGAGSAARARFWHTACKKSRRLSAKSSAPPLLTSAPPWRAPLLIRKPTNHPERLAVPANSGDRSGRRRGRLFLSPNRKIRTLAAGSKTPAPQPDFRQPPVTVSWPKRPLTGQAATTTVPSRQWPQTRACDTGIVAIVVDP